ncbi:hypothetical protein ACCS99_20020 [Rhizobium ruizarguesonis]
MTDEYQPGSAEGAAGSEDSEDADSDAYADQFAEMASRFSVWANGNGFDLATNLREEASRIVERYRIQAGDFSVQETFTIPAQTKLRSLLDRAAVSDYHLGAPIDPRAFDFVKLDIFAWDRGYRVTSSSGGRHGSFSFHTDGRAIDVGTNGKSTAEIEAMRQEFRRYGLRIYDETDSRNWTANTTGFHLHVDTGTQEEVVERTRAGRNGLTREDLGLGASWPLRERAAGGGPAATPPAPALRIRTDSATGGVVLRARP